MVRHAPIHRRSGHSDIAICCGRNVRGSSPSTSVVPLSNQVTTLNHKRFKGFKMFSDGHLEKRSKPGLARDSANQVRHRPYPARCCRSEPFQATSWLARYPGLPRRQTAPDRPARPATIGFQIQTLMLIRAAQIKNQPASVAFDPKADIDIPRMGYLFMTRWRVA